MRHGRATRQKTVEQMELALEARGESPHGQRSGEAPTTSHGDDRSGGGRLLMEQAVGRTNALAALKRVKQNKGSPGVDGMTVEELPPYLVTHWEGIREQLLAGTYQPQPVRRHDIPKRLSSFARRSPGSFAQAVRRATGIAGFHVHQMRHTFACQWVERGGNLAALQQILGHASIETTQRYARLLDDAVMREARRVHAS